MSDLSGDRVFPATPRRRQQAREDGHVARSRDLSAAMLLLGSLLIVMQLGPGMAESFASFARTQLGQPAALTLDVDTAVTLGHSVLLGVGRVVLPALVLFATLAVLVNVGQIGFLVVPKRVAPDLGRVNPFRGTKRLFSAHSLGHAILGLLKIAVVIAVAGWSLWEQRQQWAALGLTDSATMVSSIAEMVLWTAGRVTISLLILGIADYGFQRWKYERDLRMTAEEMREELRNQEGDPQLAKRRRQLRQSQRGEGIEKTIPAANLIIHDASSVAVALAFNTDTLATPRVIAKGTAGSATKIQELAQRHGIHQVDQPHLARSLYQSVATRQAIPQEHYALVARLLHDVAAVQRI